MVAWPERPSRRPPSPLLPYSRATAARGRADERCPTLPPARRTARSLRTPQWIPPAPPTARPGVTRHDTTCPESPPAPGRPPVSDDQECSCCCPIRPSLNVHTATVPVLVSRRV